MPSNIHEFEADLARFAKLVEVDFGVVITRTALSLDRRIVQRTPVDTGRARASWFMSLDQPSSEVQPPGFTASGQQAGAVALSQAQDAVNQLEADPFREVWISNNVEYISALENGHSQQQAPIGMVAVSLAEEEAEIAGVLG